jgi:F420-dependent oxidoreductase-like protein
MQAMTIDGLAGGGRMVLGLGVSGPQIVEGWYGQPWGKPYWRVRDYIEILRKIFRRETPVTHDGREITLPFGGKGSAQLGKPLRSIIHQDHDIPIWLGAGSESMLRLSGELCDGLMPLRFVPAEMPWFRQHVEQGFSRAGNRRTWGSFAMEAAVPVRLTEDVGEALQAMKPGVALYVGGMGHPAMNFHKRAMERRGYAEAAARIEELFLAGRRQEAAAAVPDEFVDEQALVGPPGRIRERYRAWAGCGLSGIHVSTRQAAVIELMAEIAGISSAADEGNEESTAWTTSSLPMRHTTKARSSGSPSTASARAMPRTGGCSWNWARRSSPRRQTTRCGSSSSAAPGRCSHPGMTWAQVSQSPSARLARASTRPSG